MFSFLVVIVVLFFLKAVYLKTLKYSIRQMHHLLKNTIKPLFAIISEFKVKGKFIKFTLIAGGG